MSKPTDLIIHLGTRFMCTVERQVYCLYDIESAPYPVSDIKDSPIHQNIKEKIVQSTEQDTVHIFRTLRNTARVFKNKVSQEVVALERRPGGAKFEDLRELVSGARGRVVYENGDPDYGIWSAGVTVGLIKDIPTCEELVSTIEREAEAIIDGLGKLKVPVKAKL